METPHILTGYNTTTVPDDATSFNVHFIDINSNCPLRCFTKILLIDNISISGAINVPGRLAGDMVRYAFGPGFELSSLRIFRVKTKTAHLPLIINA